MGKINLGRLVLGGIVAGVVFDILAYLVDGVWLAPLWNGGLKALGRPDLGMGQIMWFNVLGLAGGLVTIWVYAAIRPRFGGSAKTAVCCGFTVWILAVLIPNTGFMYVDHLFSRHLTLYTTVGGLVEIVGATIAGAWLYQEAA